MRQGPLPGWETAPDLHFPGGAEGTRTPDPHTASPDVGGPRSSTEVRNRRSAGVSLPGGLWWTTADGRQLCPELGQVAMLNLAAGPSVGSDRS